MIYDNLLSKAFMQKKREIMSQTHAFAVRPPLLKLSTISLALFGLSGLAATASAQTSLLSVESGVTTSSPTWREPNNSFNPTTDRGAGFYYNSHNISSTEGGRYKFLMTRVGVTGAMSDPTMYLYADSFNPASSLTNVLIGDDDTGRYWTGDIRDAGFVYVLATGASYTVVGSHFVSGSTGNYILTVEQMDSQELTWEGVNDGGTSNPAEWGYHNRNWTDGSAIIAPDNAYTNYGRVATRQFATGDKVVFDDTGNANTNIAVNSSGVKVSDMVVDGSLNYVFSGGSITGDSASAYGTTLTGAQGALSKDGSGSVTFNNPIQFEQMDIANGLVAVGNANSNTGVLNLQLPGSLEINSSGILNVDHGGMLAGTLQGAGQIHLQGGTLYVTNNQPAFSGELVVNSGAAAVFDDGAATTRAYAFGGSVHNAGTLTIGHGAVAGDILNIGGGYVGNSGVLSLNAVLAGDTTSITDKLVINGNASGTTYVNVNSMGGLGGQTVEGIQIIDVIGTSTDTAFVQSGRIVAGAYEYSLVKGSANGLNPQSWYLTSEYLLKEPGGGTDHTGIHVMRPEGGSYIANLSAANTMFSTRLHDRISEPQYTDLLSGQDKATSLWIRYHYGHNRFEDGSGQLSTKSDRSIVQIGGDIAQWSSNERNRFHIGVMGGYGRTDSDTDSDTSGYHSSGKVDGYSVGVYGTWYANQEDKSGLYVDGWLLWNDMSAKVHGDGVSGESYDIKGISASLEAGYAFQIGQMNEDYGVWIQPQAQVIWMGAKADDHIEHNGTFVTSNDSNVQTRLGVRGYLSNLNSSRTDQNMVQPYLELNWIHNTKRFNVDMGSTEMRADGAKDVGEVRIGMEANINRNTTLWFNVGHQMGSNSYRDTTALFGLKYSF
ncbi:autotransporter outer membrane beta-barrel domain-containing protein [Saezia sanguinis]|uniref:autotransporter outer membrane beta-barrel domain-containing protein n=1 Tax=Saezia sanguinis TaxID=1965230 RepID=UPI0030308549